MTFETFKVLDKGHVRLVDVMGSDEAIVQAARVSYGKGTKTIREDRGLIRYLMRNRHSSPLEMCELKFHVRVPMDCWRQWIRHRTAQTNEYSTRYSEAIDDKQTTELTAWRVQSKGNKQGSGEYLDSRLGGILTRAEESLHDRARQAYQERLDMGVAREQARKDLPLSTYTEAYWKINLHNLFHFLSLRMDPHAQLEIRAYANTIGYKIVAKIFPHAWEAFVDYRINGMFLTSADIMALRGHINNSTAGSDFPTKRERTEFEGKLKRIIG